MSDYAVRLPADRAGLWGGGETPLPALDIELTERCNNDCIHCCINLPAADSAARARELTTVEHERILCEAADLGCLLVRFTGGEPLLRPDFEELYLCARRLGMKVLLFTNARLLTPRIAELLARIPPLLPVEVTVYGMRTESYEAVSRVPGSYAQFRRGIDLLRGRRIPFLVKGVPLPPNIGEIDQLDAWAATIPGVSGPASQVVQLDLRNRRDSPSRNELIRGLRLDPRAAVAILARGGDRRRRELASFCQRFMGPPGDRLFTCGAGSAPSVDAHGRLQPCMGVRAPELTWDLRQGPLRQGLGRLSRKLAAMRAGNPDYLARCAVCFLKGLCEQCPAKSWAESGTLDTPVEYYCELAHEEARALGLLGSGEAAWKVLDFQRRLELLSA